VQGEHCRRKITDWCSTVGNPHNGALRDVVVPYTKVIVFFGGFGWGEEAQGKGAIIGHKSVTWGERLSGDKAVAGCT